MLQPQQMELLTLLQKSKLYILTHNGNHGPIWQQVQHYKPPLKDKP